MLSVWCLPPTGGLWFRLQLVCITLYRSVHTTLGPIRIPNLDKDWSLSRPVCISPNMFQQWQKLYLFQFILLGVQFLFIIGDLQEGLHFGEQPPPLPVPQFQVGCAVPLYDANSTQLLQSLLIISAWINIYIIYTFFQSGNFTPP